MPDINLQKFKITGQADANVAFTVARVLVEAEVWDGDTLLADYTGANAVQFAFRVQGMSVAKHKQLADDIALLIIRMKAGLD